MLNDPIVEEMRKNGQLFAARYNHDLTAMCNALKEKSFGHKVVNLNSDLSVKKKLSGN